MNFIERQGMVRFEVFPIQCMMHEILLKIHWMPEFFFTKKIVGGKSVVSYSLVFLVANVFLDSLSTGEEPKKSRAEVAFFSLGLTGLKQE